MKIGFYDSGIGGLSVLQTAMEMLPNEEFIYYADTDHVPYGEKSNDEILAFARRAVDFLIAKDAKAIVIACNTATSVAAKYLRGVHTLPIIGMEPAVKPAVEEKNHKRILVSATPVTIREKKLHDLIERVDLHHETDLIALGGLVTFAERGEFDSPAVHAYLKEALAPFAFENYSAFVLGCTHFNYFKDTLRQILPTHIRFVDGCDGTARQLKNVLTQNGLLEQNKRSAEFYFSGRPADSDKEKAYFHQLLGRLEAMAKIS